MKLSLRVAHPGFTQEVGVYQSMYSDHFMMVIDSDVRFDRHGFASKLLGVCKDQAPGSYRTKYFDKVFHDHNGDWVVYSNHLKDDQDIHGNDLVHIPKWSKELPVEKILERCHFVQQPQGEAKKGRPPLTPVRPALYPFTVVWQYEMPEEEEEEKDEAPPGYDKDELYSFDSDDDLPELHQLFSETPKAKDPAPIDNQEGDGVPSPELSETVKSTHKRGVSETTPREQREKEREEEEQLRKLEPTRSGRERRKPSRLTM